MQTADCGPYRPCRLCRPCKLTTFFLTVDLHLFGSSYKLCSLYPTVCYLPKGCTNSPSDCWFNRRPRLIDFVREIPFSPKYTKIKHRNKLHLPQHRVFFYVFHTFWAQIATILNVFVVCSFISFIQFVVLLVFFQFLWSSLLHINEARTVNRSDVVPQIAFASQSNIPYPLDYEYFLFPFLVA